MKVTNHMVEGRHIMTLHMIRELPHVLHSLGHRASLTKYICCMNGMDPNLDDSRCNLFTTISQILDRLSSIMNCSKQHGRVSGMNFKVPNGHASELPTCRIFGAN